MKTLTMPKQPDWVLPSLAVLTLLVGGLIFKLDQRLPQMNWEGRDLIAGLDPKELVRLKFKTKSSEFTLQKEGGGFTLPSLNGAPAEAEKLNEVLLKLSGVQIQEVIGSKRDWEKLHVTEGSSELTLELFTGQETPTWKIYLGKNVPGKSGRAVRVDGREEVFLTKDYLYLSEVESDFVAKKAFSIDSSKIVSLDLYRQDKKFSDQNLSVSQVTSSLSPLHVKSHFKTGLLPKDLGKLNWIWRAELVSESGLIYNLSFAQKEERWFAKVLAGTNQSIENTGPIVDFKLVSLKGMIDQFNQKNMPWIWELSSESIQKLENQVFKIHSQKK